MSEYSHVPPRGLLADSAYIIRRDGNAWFATRSDFVDLQESLAGFGDTPVEALRALMLEQMKEASAK